MKKISSYIALILLLSACSDAASHLTQPETLTPKSSASSSTQTEVSLKLKILVNDTTLTATFEENSSADSLVSLLRKGSITLDMHDYGSFEKVGDLPVALPRNDTQIDTDAGDIILYQGKSITIYYDKNSWNFTRLARIDNVDKKRLKEILGKGNAEVTFSIEE